MLYLDSSQLLIVWDRTNISDEIIVTQATCGAKAIQDHLFFGHSLLHAPTAGETFFSTRDRENSQTVPL
jgi:hypothetical protein